MPEIKCQSIQQYKIGIKSISANQERKYRICGSDSSYNCNTCGKSLCEIHALADSKTGNLYCKEHHPNENMRKIPDLILIDKPI